jgi:uncharacterized protein (TIGR00369 family)
MSIDTPDPGSGFSNHLGAELVHMSPDSGELRLTLAHNHLQPAGIVHGGVYCAIVETLGSLCGHEWLQHHGGGTVVGVNNTTDFLRPISTGSITAHATPLHRGRRQQLWLVTIVNDEGRIAARGQVRLQNLPLNSALASPAPTTAPGRQRVSPSTQASSASPTS